MKVILLKDVKNQGKKVMSKLSIVVPSFNESENVKPLVDQLDEALKGIDHEIIFVDDSKDNTPDVIREIQATKPHVRLEHRVGAIVLMHNVSCSNLDALETVIKGLLGQGYRFASLNELEM